MNQLFSDESIFWLALSKLHDKRFNGRASFDQLLVAWFSLRESRRVSWFRIIVYLELIIFTEQSSEHGCYIDDRTSAIRRIWSRLIQYAYTNHHLLLYTITAPAAIFIYFGHKIGRNIGVFVMWLQAKLVANAYLTRDSWHGAVDFRHPWTIAVPRLWIVALLPAGPPASSPLAPVELRSTAV